MVFICPALLAIGAMLACAAPAAAQPGSVSRPPPATVIDVASGTSTVRYLLLMPPGVVAPRPTAAVILFAGGDGYLQLTSAGEIKSGLKGNFLVRSRELFAQNNLITAVVAAPNAVRLSQKARWSADHARVYTAVIADLRRRTEVRKVWLIGTSSGTLSVANI